MTEQTRPTDTNEAAERLRDYFEEEPGGVFRSATLDAALRIERENALAEAAQRTAPLDPLLPDSAVAEMLRKVIRQYHGNGHREGSWTHCDNRWCRDAQAVLEGAAPRAEGLDVDTLRAIDRWIHTTPGVRFTPEAHTALYAFYRSHGYDPHAYPMHSRPSDERDTESEASL